MPKTVHKPTQRSLSEVKAKLLQPALTSHFDVVIGLPQGPLNTILRRFLGTNQDKLHLLCSEAVLPGSQLATTEMTNDFTGVTERHAYRRIYDETIDLSFYVDAANYWPIRFFEEWISAIVNEDQEQAKSKNYTYRVKYPDDYIADQGLKVVKFEKDIASVSNPGTLEYEFIRSYPRSITSMPVSYDASSLLKCSVQMTYTRYVVVPSSGANSTPYGVFNPVQQAEFNVGGIPDLIKRAAGEAITRKLGDVIPNNVVGGFARETLRNIF